MRARPVVRWLVPAIGALALWLPSRPADACQPDTCIRPRFAPRDGGSVPANGVLAFQPPGDFHDGGNLPDGLAIYGATDRRVVDFEVAADPAFSQSFLVRFPEPLEPGDYVATFPDRGCYGQAPGPDHVIHFTVTPPAALPTFAGQGSGAPPVREHIQVWTSSGSCFTEIDASVAVASAVPACSTTPWRDVARYSLVLDRYWGGEPFYGEPPAWRLHADCGGAEFGADVGVGEGTHEATLRLQLPGFTEPIPSTTFAVTLDCDASGPAPSTSAPICVETLEDPVDPEEPLDPSDPVDPADPTDREPRDAERSGAGADASGCTAAGGTGLAALPLLLVLGLARSRSRNRSRERR